MMLHFNLNTVPVVYCRMTGKCCQITYLGNQDIEDLLIGTCFVEPSKLKIGKRVEINGNSYTFSWSLR